MITSERKVSSAVEGARSRLQEHLYKLVIAVLTTAIGLLVLVSLHELIGAVIVGAGLGMASERITGMIPLLVQLSGRYQILRTTGAYAGEFDEAHNGRLICNLLDSVFRATNADADHFVPESKTRQFEDERVGLRIIGVTLQSLLGRNGVLTTRMLEPNARTVRTRILIINPVSTQAIVRAVAESSELYPHTMNIEPYRLLLEHTLETHRRSVLFTHFEEVANNVRSLRKFNERLNVECRVYTLSSFVFSIWTADECVLENLVLKENRSGTQRISGQLPLVAYRKGRVHEAVRANFDFIWDTLSIPLDHFDIDLECRGFLGNILPILLGLQRQYWEKQYSERRLSKTDDWSTEIIATIETMSGKRSVLDLGCGDGGGGAIKIAEYCVSRQISFVGVDIAHNAVEQFRASLGCASEFVSLEAEDMHAFLFKSQAEHFDIIYANISLIYMPHARAKEIARQVYRCLKPGGVFRAKVFSTRYFDIPKSKRPLDCADFDRFPVAEDLRVIIRGPRTGEVRRFYESPGELIAELTGDGESGGFFGHGTCTAGSSGEVGQVIEIVATKEL